MLQKYLNLKAPTFNATEAILSLTKIMKIILV